MQFKSKFRDDVSQPFDSFLEAVAHFLKAGGQFPPTDWGFKLNSGIIIIAADQTESLLKVTELMATLSGLNILCWGTHLQEDAPEPSTRFLEGLAKAAHADMPHAVNQYLSTARFRETQAA